MYFGLTNSPTTFMELMNHVFWLYLNSFVIVFIDEILLYSTYKVDYLIHLRIVL